MLLELGCSHLRAVGVLLLFNIALIIFVFSFQHIKAETLLAIEIGIAIIATKFLSMLNKKKYVKTGELIQLSKTSEVMSSSNS